MGMSGSLVIRPAYLTVGSITIRLSGAAVDKASVTAGSIIGTVALGAPVFTGRSAAVPAGTRLAGMVERTVAVSLPQRRTLQSPFTDLKRPAPYRTGMLKVTTLLSFVGVTSAGAAIGLAIPQPSASPPGRSGVTFTICQTGGGTNCVVDGDTAWIDSVKVRVADIDAPETHPPRCAREAELGNRATRRLGELLSAGPFDMAAVDRDEDRYGRKLRVITRGGRSLGDQLVAEGLARTWEGRRRPWC